MKSSARPRVLMLLENDAYPQDDRVRREAKALATAGYDVSVICPATSRQSWHEIIDGVAIYRYPPPPSGNGLFGYLCEYVYAMLVTFVISLAILVRKGFDVIHTHNPPDTFVVIAAFYKLLGKRFVFDHHDLAPEMYYARLNGNGNAIVFRTLAFFEKLSCRLADRVIATNESYKVIEMERGGLSAHRITVVRNGPDSSRARAAQANQALRQKAPTIIAYLGVMGFQDGVEYLLHALAHLRNGLGRKDFYCVIMGKGDALPMLRHLTATLGLDDCVGFTGWLYEEDLARNLSAADVCVVPDPSNAFTDRSTMTKLMDFMAFEKPVVAFDLPEHRITAGDAAVYAQPNDPRDLAAKIQALMDDPLAREQLGKRGGERIRTKLAWCHQEPHLLAAYEALGN